MTSKSGEGTELTITAVGDMWEGGFRRMAVYDEPEFMVLVKLIRDADVGFVNMETNLLDKQNKNPYAGVGQPLWAIERHQADPIIAEDLRWLGFNICSCAMNHSHDFGPEGIFSTIRVLDKVGFTQAGIGATLSEASLPGYMQTKKGAVAIISSYAPAFHGIIATDPSPEHNAGWPGVNGIRADWILDPETWEAYKNMAERIGGGLMGVRPAEPWDREYFGVDTLQVNGFMFVLKGKEPGNYARTKVRDEDLKRNVRSVKGAAGIADWVIYALHDHTSDGLGSDPDVPSGSTMTLARACIDAGADVFIGTGMQGYRGIELYRNKPIFYNIGVWQETVESMWRQPMQVYEALRLTKDDDISTVVDRMNVLFNRKAGYRGDYFRMEKELYWSGLLVTMKLEGEQGPDRKVTEIKLYPCDLRGDLPRAQRGRPILAKGKVSKKVLEVLKKKSTKLGTEIEIKGDIGVVKL